MAHPLPEDLLVAHLVAQQQRPLDAATRERLAQALLDWFTAGWSGAAMPLAAPYRQVAESVFGAGGPVPVFGGAPLGCLGAGFANACIAHLREIDDAHRTALLHPGVVAVSPVLALAAERPITQARAAAAMVAGYEVAVRLGEVLGGRHAGLFHATATAGCVGAAAAAAVALGLPAAQLHHALGHAATQAAGLWQLIDDGAHESKSLHPGYAVRNGLMAAFAAQAGLPAARAFVSGPRGLHALLAGDGDLAQLTQGLDAPARIHTATIKAWPSCAMTFTALDALQALRTEHALQADQVASVEVAIFSHALRIASVDWPVKPAETPFSLRYLVAALLHHGQVGIAQTETPALGDPALLALGQRVRVRASDAFQALFPARRAAEVTVHCHDGRVLQCRRDLRRGDPEDPFDWPQLGQRMRAFAPGIGEHTAQALLSWCEGWRDPARDVALCQPGAELFGSVA